MYKGIAKLIEESGEVNQELGKLIAYPTGPHPDGKGSVRERLLLELGDLSAAIGYFIDSNFNESERLECISRSNMKYDLFKEWDSKGEMH